MFITNDFKMTLQEFINTIYAWLTQRGATLFVSEDALLNFTNYALNDIYSYEWRYWSFMYQQSEQIVIPEWTTDKFYTITLPVPLVRVLNVYDKKLTYSLSAKQLHLKQVDLNIEESWDCFFLPMKKTFKIYNNIEWYQLDYIWWFNRITDTSTELPIPDSFVHALYDLTMAYILPVYAQYGENRETNIYQRWLTKLKELAKSDSLEILQVSSNIK